MSLPIISNTHFPNGRTNIIHKEHDTTANMAFSCLKLCKGERLQQTSPNEIAYLLMSGKIQITFQQETFYLQRFGYFEEDPSVLHCCANETVSIEALSDAEILLIETENVIDFESILFTADQAHIKHPKVRSLLESDNRGMNLLEQSSYRLVRTVFDKRNRPESNLVVGEIITFQGHWSSYPPHYHPQAEIYHYRFSEPQGFAFGEYGEQIFRLKHNDTYLIPPDKTHAHCTAPGYALYTLWFIRHLPNQAYHVPTFQAEHDWTRHPSANLRAWHSRQLLRK